MAEVNHNHESHNGRDVAYKIRPMKYEEVAKSAKLFSDAGLNDSISILETYYETDPSGFVVAVDESTGRVIGSCAAPRTTHRTAFLGLYVVDPRYQKLGIGVQLFNHCLDNVGRDNNCGLCAIPSKFKIYKDKAGFRVIEGRQMVIAEGVPRDFSSLKPPTALDSKYHVVQLCSVDYQDKLVRQIVAYDQTVHLDNRDKLLRINFAKTDTITFAVLDSESDKVVGYGCNRPDIVNKAQVGPLYADNPLVAEVLLGELFRADRVSNGQACLITADNSPGGIRLATEVLQLPETCRCEKLYTKFVPPFNYDLLYYWHTPDFSC